MRSESADRGEMSPRRRINLELRFTQYHLPPLDSANYGKSALWGNGISRAFQELIAGDVPADSCRAPGG